MAGRDYPESGSATYAGTRLMGGFTPREVDGPTPTHRREEYGYPLHDPNLVMDVGSRKAAVWLIGGGQVLVKIGCQLRTLDNWREVAAGFIRSEQGDDVQAQLVEMRTFDLLDDLIQLRLGASIAGMEQEDRFLMGRVDPQQQGEPVTTGDLNGIWSRHTRRVVDEMAAGADEAGIFQARPEVDLSRTTGTYGSPIMPSYKELEELRNAVAQAWGVIANVSYGNWGEQDVEWQRSAARWRDQHMGGIEAHDERPGEQPAKATTARAVIERCAAALAAMAESGAAMPHWVSMAKAEAESYIESTTEGDG